MDQAALQDNLIHEIWRQDLAAVRRLLTAGADPNRPGKAWSSGIACAAENDETGEIIRALVAAGADVNLRDDHGVTPLHYAVDVAIDGAAQQNRSFIDWSVVGVLLDLGADPTLRDGRGRTVFEIATAYGGQAPASFDRFIRSRVE